MLPYVRYIKFILIAERPAGVQQTEVQHHVCAEDSPFQSQFRVGRLQKCLYLHHA